MEELLRLLKDGHSRTIEMLASALCTTPADVRRRIEYLEHIGVLRHVPLAAATCGSCGSCGGCASPGSTAACRSCMPDAAIINMGEMWEVRPFDDASISGSSPSTTFHIG